MLFSGEQDHFASVTSSGVESLEIFGMAVRAEVVLVGHMSVECILRVYLEVLIFQESMASQW